MKSDPGNHRQRKGFSPTDKFRCRRVSQAALKHKAVRSAGTSHVSPEELKKQYQPCARRPAWRLCRLLFLHLVEGNLQRVKELCKQTQSLHLEKDIDNSEPQELYITQIDELIGEKLFNELLVETVWDLSQCRRSEVEMITQFGAGRVKWCDALLAEHGYQWKPEMVSG